MSIYDNAYEIATGVEIDELLSELPFDLIEANLEDQIKNPLTMTNNYLNVVSEKYEIFKDNFSDDGESMGKLKTSIENVFLYALREMNDSMNLGLDMEDKYDDIVGMTENLYTYFILQYRKNVYNFFYKYIKINKKSLAEYYDKFGKKKDVTTTNLKKQMKNKEDITIISNLPNIINYIKNLDIDALTFVKYTLDDDMYESYYVRDLIEQNTLTGDFVNTYLDIIFDETTGALDEMISQIKTKLINKFIA